MICDETAILLLRLHVRLLIQSVSELTSILHH